MTYTDGRRSTQERVADTYKFDQRMEDLIDMRKKRPGIYDGLNSRLKMSVGYYEEAKKAAEAEGINTDPAA